MHEIDGKLLHRLEIFHDTEALLFILGIVLWSRRTCKVVAAASSRIRSDNRELWVHKVDGKLLQRRHVFKSTDTFLLNSSILLFISRGTREVVAATGSRIRSDNRELGVHEIDGKLLHRLEIFHDTETLLFVLRIVLLSRRAREEVAAASSRVRSHNWKLWVHKVDGTLLQSLAFR